MTQLKRLAMPPPQPKELVMISRRSLLKGLMAGAALGTLDKAYRYSFDVDSPFISSAKARTTRSNTLPIPPLMEGTIKDGVRVYDLNLQTGVQEFIPGKKTKTLGINQDYLGPTLKIIDGETIRLNVKNGIGETTTMHWHGMHLPAKADGGPHQKIKAGDIWSPEWTVKQKAATYWYHPHLMHKTGLHAYKGMAGAIIVEDKHSQKLALPSNYGVDDIPIVLQDRYFDRQWNMTYVSSMHDKMMGMKGNILLVNGAIEPTFTATTGKIRLRLLNGSNARTYTLGFQDNTPFDMVASDGSLLPTPVRLKRITLSPAERAEIVVDMSALKEGAGLTLKSFGFDASTSPTGSNNNGGMRRGSGMMGGGMMGMMGDDGRKFTALTLKTAPNLKPSAPLPKTLINLPRLQEKDARKTRHFEMGMVMGPMVMMGRIRHPLTINGKVMDINRIDERITLGDTEIWEITNPSGVAHPFHIHDIQFQILDRNGKKPPASESGLKDTVLLYPGETVRIIAKFEDYADPDRPYMYHCHILEHEDWGMMGQFTVEQTI